MSRLQGALGSKVAAARFCSVVCSWCQRTPDLFDCLRSPQGRASLIASILAAANVDLSLDGVAGQAYILPFRQHGTMTAQLIPGYRGLIQLMYRSRQVRHANARYVLEGEPFEWAFGLPPVLKHSPQRVRTRDWVPDLAKVTHVYAYFETITGGREFEVMTWGQVMEIKKRSRAAGSKFSPWNSDYPEDVLWMARKTVLRQLAKLAPVSAQVQRIIAADESFDDRTLDFVMAGDDDVYEAVLAQESGQRALPDPAVQFEVPGVNAPAARERERPKSARAIRRADTPEERRRAAQLAALEQSERGDLDPDAPISAEELPE